MTQQIKTKYQWLEDFINGFEELQDKTHNARCEIVKTKDLIQHQEHTFKQCLEDIHKRLEELKSKEITFTDDIYDLNEKIENYNSHCMEKLQKLEANEGDLVEIKQELNEIYERIGLIETEKLPEIKEEMKID